MQFRYDFVGDKLDLSRFKKQVAQNLIRYEENIEYYFYVLGYKIQAYIARNDLSTNYIIDFYIMELQRDDDGEINYNSAAATVRVTEDLRFKEFPDVLKHYTHSASQGYFKSNSVDEIVNVLSDLIKIIYKINNLKAFL